MLVYGWLQPLCSGCLLLTARDTVLSLMSSQFLVVLLIFLFYFTSVQSFLLFSSKRQWKVLSLFFSSSLLSCVYVCAWEEKEPLLGAIRPQNEVELPDQCFRVDKINYPTSPYYYLGHAQSDILLLKCKGHDHGILTQGLLKLKLGSLKV